MSRSTERPCTTMFGELAALIIFGTKALILTAEVPQLISLTEVERGNNVSLKCPASENRYFYCNVSKEDEATYFCQTGSTFQQTFVGGTLLAVNDQDQQKHYSVKQSPETASVRPGASVILQCSLLSEHKENLVQCPGEHSVHWFRAGSGRSHPGIIYTQSSRRDGQEEKSCVYSLSKTIHNSSDAGTYYCAVVTCGEILFGGGTKVQTTQEQNLLVIALGVLLALCVIVIAVLVSLPRS
ncbi:unnamed protein product [Pleuronectes platessa]|uniref:Ig-like domain-containing protein n=1 Tax=Pleuronectes platessa TaxID=8262 RepID=A0A9N7UHI8_PLEPL|nr:unnamed protein product [Pleuronectes platessa]